jgi:cyclopropane-fatty-acyl-phospholipid synthase
MKNDNYKKLINDFVKPAGLKINGNQPWDVKINDPDVYKIILTGDTIALGEAYMDGKWDCDQIDELIHRLMTNNLVDAVTTKAKIKLALGVVESKLFSHHNSKAKAFKVAETHYNLGNDLFQAMLDDRLVYTCGYWSGTPAAKTLNEAQEAKLDLVCRKIGLKAGMKVLDIGGGWGSFAKFAAEKYKAEVVNVTVSKEQVALANELCKGLTVENRLQDYRDIKGKFDRIVSIGMFEHVGYKNYRTYFKVAARCLKEDGIFLLHCIGANKSVTGTDPWIEKYIFPNSMLPSIEQIGKSIEDLFIMEDWHNFGPDYDKTLMQWYKNFQKAWPKLKENYDERFYRMWRLYLLSCAGLFRARHTQLWQIVLSPKGIPGGYKSVR